MEWLCSPCAKLQQALCIFDNPRETSTDITKDALFSPVPGFRSRSSSISPVCILFQNCFVFSQPSLFDGHFYTFPFPASSCDSLGRLRTGFEGLLNAFSLTSICHLICRYKLTMAPKTMLQRLSLICLISSTVPSATALSSALSTAQALGVLEARASTCANSTATSCSTVDSRLPGDICCATGTSCISLDHGFSAICCPEGIDCSAILPITCNIALQDPNQHPDAVIQTTNLTATLPTCGDNCCPFGYTCASGNCLLDIDTSVGFSQKGSNTTASTSTNTSSPSATATAPTGIDSTKSQATGSCDKFPAAAVAAGFFPGMLAGALIAILLVLFLGRRKNHDSRPSSDDLSNYKSHSRGYSHDNKYEISDPIPLETQSARSDFLGRTTTRAKSFFSNKSPRLISNDSWKMPTPPVPNNVPREMAGGLMPVTPERQVREEMPRQSSTESITVYSPPSTSQVAPVRGMASQRTESGIGSPFKTPPNRNDAYHDSTMTTPQQTPYAEVLTPARYGESQKRSSPSEKRTETRPNTTFTMVMQEAGMPDPLRVAMPAMPPIPKGLDVKAKGKSDWR